jgi:hypothetical protein
LPVAATVFPREIYRAPKSWAEQTYSNLIYWNEAEHGGHFAAFEQPDIFVEEMRSAFRKLRDQKQEVINLREKRIRRSRRS